MSQKPPAELNMDVALKLRIGCHVSSPLLDKTGSLGGDHRFSCHPLTRRRRSSSTGSRPTWVGSSGNSWVFIGCYRDKLLELMW